jgi:hypothetical protein
MSNIKRIGNFIEAVKDFIQDDFTQVDDEQYEERLKACEGCKSYFRDYICMHPACGCFLKVKARWRSQDCPIKRWPRIPLTSVEENKSEAINMDEELKNPPQSFRCCGG